MGAYLTQIIPLPYVEEAVIHLVLDFSIIIQAIDRQDLGDLPTDLDPADHCLEEDPADHCLEEDPADRYLEEEVPINQLLEEWKQLQ